MPSLLDPLIQAIKPIAELEKKYKKLFNSISNTSTLTDFNKKWYDGIQKFYEKARKIVNAHIPAVTSYPDPQAEVNEFIYSVIYGEHGTERIATNVVVDAMGLQKAAKAIKALSTAVAALAAPTAEVMSASLAKFEVLAKKALVQHATLEKAFVTGDPKLKAEVVELATTVAEMLAGSQELRDVIMPRDGSGENAKARAENLFSRLGSLSVLRDAQVMDDFHGKFSSKVAVAKIVKLFDFKFSQVKKANHEFSKKNMMNQLDGFLTNLRALPPDLAKVPKIIAKEKEQVEKAAEAPPKAPLGRLAFPGHRKNKPFEADTEREEELYNDISAHFNENEPLNAADAKLLKTFLDKGWYEDVFHEPNGSIYRGMSVNADWLKMALKVKKLSNHGSVTKSFTFTPRGGSSSWSTSKSVAQGFKSSGDGNFNVILHAKTEQNPKRFLTGPGGLYKVDGFNEFPDEKEVVGIGPIKVFKVEWNNNYD
jgi:hypothetical protein